MFQKIINYINKAVRDPFYFINWAVALFRGTFYIVYFRIKNPNYKIGFPFFATTTVRILGPGRVEIGSGCWAVENVFRGLTIVTFSPDSHVAIGRRCLLGGLTIRCYRKIELRDHIMTAISLIQDSYFLNLSEVRSSVIDEVNKLQGLVIDIGENVWFGADSIILSGSRIGRDSIIAAGSVTIGAEVNDYNLVVGNPSRKTLPIDKLLQLKGIA